MSDDSKPADGHSGTETQSQTDGQSAVTESNQAGNSTGQGSSIGTESGQTSHAEAENSSGTGKQQLAAASTSSPASSETASNKNDNTQSPDKTTEPGQTQATADDNVPTNVQQQLSPTTAAATASVTKAGDAPETATTNNINLPSGQQNWIGDYLQILDTDIDDNGQLVPPLLRSALTYIVLEHELKLKGKRRIVFLNSADLLYGSTTGKCVFLPIDWQLDIGNVVKVHGGHQTWQTTFAELLTTNPIALLSLFANNEVWAEGNYEPLA